MPQSPETIGPYSLEKLLGSGGMGDVYQAYDHRLHRRVAIKQIQNGLESDDTSRERFLHEARSAASLSHPSIVQIHDILEDESGDWIVMERVDGPTVAQLVAQGPLPVPRAVSIARQVAEGLVEAHDRDILHRDLKSENVMLARGDRAKILDFGLAKKLRPEEGEASLEEQGRVLGTCRAMSPEQARDQELDERSDLFALGVLLYEMLTGESPFQGDNHRDTLTRVCHFQPPPVTDRYPEVPADLSALVDRLLQKDREKRPQTAREVAEFLATLDSKLSPSGSASGPVLDTVPPPAVVVGPAWMTESVYWSPQDRRSPRKWLWWGGTTIIAVLIVVVALAILFEPWNWLSTSSEVSTQEPSIPIRPTVAVLGLDNRSENEDLDWISAGSTAALNAQLSAGTEGLHTVASENVARIRRELDLEIGETFSTETLSTLRPVLGAEWVVMGFFSEASRENLTIHLILYLQNTRTGQFTNVLNELATEDDVLEVARRTGREIRQMLGAGDVTQAERQSARAELPRTEKAKRLYSQGLDALEEYDFAEAKTKLEQAIEAESEFPLAHLALAEALKALGQDIEAEKAAGRARERLGNLSLVHRHRIRGRYHELAFEPKESIQHYKDLWESSFHHVEYGLLYARALTSSNRGEEALLIVEELRSVPSPASQDVRIDLEEARALQSLSRYKDLLRVSQQAESRSRELGARILTGRVLLYKAYALLRRSEIAESRKAAQQALDLFVEAGDPLGEAQALKQIANVEYESGRLDEARGLFEQFGQKMQDMGNLLGQSQALHNIASCWTLQGSIQSSFEPVRRAIQIAKQIGNPRQEALTRIHLAGLERLSGDLGPAQATIATAINLAEIADYPYALYPAWIVQGEIYLTSGEIDKAWDAFNRVHTALVGQDDFRYLAWSLEGLGSVERMRGNLDRSFAHHEQALKIRQELGDKYYEGVGLLALSRIALEQAKFDEALQNAQASRRVFHGQGSFDGELRALALGISSQVELGHLGQLESTLDEAEDLLDRCESLLTRLESGIHLARGWHALGQTSRARRSLVEIRQQAADHGLVPLEIEAMLALADLEESTGHIAQAQALRQEVSRREDAQRLGLLQRKADSGLGPS